MANQQLLAEATPGSTVMVKGVVTWSRIASRLEGAELETSDARRKERGRYPISVPHTTISIENAQVLCQNPNAPTKAELAVNSALYKSASADTDTWNFTAYNKTNSLPRVGVKQPDGTYAETVLAGEIARGTEVILMVTIFRSKGWGRNGIGLDAVLCPNGQPQIFTADNMASRLASHGITWSSAPVAAAPATEPQPIAQPAAEPQQFTEPQPTFEPAFDDGFYGETADVVAAPVPGGIHYDPNEG